MKKAKKYIYPIIFSVAFLVYYNILFLLIDKVIPFPAESYAPASLAVLLIFAWIIVPLPIYCIRYNKTIIDEKLKFLFSIYNSLLIITSHVLVLPFNWQGLWRTFTHFVLWVLFGNILLLVFRLNARKHEAEHTDNNTEEIDTSTN